MSQIIGVITPYLVGTAKGDANLGPKIYFMWGSLCCISLAFSYLLVPETKGLSLEQVDLMLEETSPRTSAKWVPHSTFAADMGFADGTESEGKIEKVGEVTESTEV